MRYKISIITIILLFYSIVLLAQPIDLVCPKCGYKIKPQDRATESTAKTWVIFDETNSWLGKPHKRPVIFTTYVCPNDGTVLLDMKFTGPPESVTTVTPGGHP